MTKTLNKQANENLKRLQRTGFCVVYNIDKHAVTERTEAVSNCGLCLDCEDSPTGEFMKGDRR